MYSTWKIFGALTKHASAELKDAANIPVVIIGPTALISAIIYNKQVVYRNINKILMGKSYLVTVRNAPLTSSRTVRSAISRT